MVRLREPESGDTNSNAGAVIRQAGDSLPRGQIYERLSLLYGSPDESFLEKELVAGLRSALEPHGLTDLHHELAQMEAYLASLDDITGLAVEYVRLFRGPAKAAVYPYESMYVDGEIMGPSTMAVLDSYYEAGVSPDEGYRDLPDHVCAELEFMYYLCAEESQAADRHDLAGRLRFQQLRNSFLTAHMEKWVPRFSEAVLRNTVSPFYRALASATAEFLRHEVATVTTGHLAL